VPIEILGRREAAGEADGVRVAADRRPVDLGPPGYGSPSSRATLSKASPGRVVDGLAEQLDVVVRSRTSSSDGVAAGDRRAIVGSSRRSLLALAAQKIGADVPDQVVDRVERLARRERECLRGADPDHERAGESGSARDRDRVELVEGDSGLVEAQAECRREASGARGAATSGTTPP
jgi:hypothetical protein